MAALTIFASGPLLGTAWAQGKAEAKKDAAPAAASAPLEAQGKPAPTDAGFQEVLADYQMVLREIDRIEAATGTVEIPVSVSQLRERANMKMGKMRGWMKEHNVGDDWRYDAEHRSFLPPVKQEAKHDAGKP
ncbi:MAG TPA: hypothetical protein VKQ28_16720 [Candidatus Acidoferrum sp.]|nr:hypothetical protein [Candidatus Acidoferrum sp.]